LASSLFDQASSRSWSKPGNSSPNGGPFGGVPIRDTTSRCQDMDRAGWSMLLNERAKSGGREPHPRSIRLTHHLFTPPPGHNMLSPPPEAPSPSQETTSILPAAWRVICAPSPLARANHQPGIATPNPTISLPNRRRPAYGLRRRNGGPAAPRYGSGAAAGARRTSRRRVLSRAFPAPGLRTRPSPRESQRTIRGRRPLAPSPRPRGRKAPSCLRPGASAHGSLDARERGQALATATHLSGSIALATIRPLGQRARFSPSPHRRNDGWRASQACEPLRAEGRADGPVSGSSSQ